MDKASCLECGTELETDGPCPRCGSGDRSVRLDDSVRGHEGFRMKAREKGVGEIRPYLETYYEPKWAADRKRLERRRMTYDRARNHYVQEWSDLDTGEITFRKEGDLDDPELHGKSARTGSSESRTMASPEVAEPLTLRLGMPDGSTLSEEVTGPGGEIRFAVGAPGRRSSVWKVFAGRKKGDVYVTARGLGRAMKFSLHESGDWRCQFLTDDVAERWTGRPDRIRDRWQRPEGTRGWVRAIQIRVPYDHLSSVQDDEPGEDVTWLPEADPHRMCCVDIAIVTPDGGGLALPALPFAGFSLSTGDAVIVLYSSQSFTDADRTGIRDALGRARLTEDMRRDIAAAGDVRMGLFADGEDGLRCVWDLRLVTRPSAGPRRS